MRSRDDMYEPAIEVVIRVKDRDAVSDAGRGYETVHRLPDRDARAARFTVQAGGKREIV
jgi:hypothetical protein